MLSVKVFIVKRHVVCECDQQCNCLEPVLDSIYFNKGKAEDAANKGYDCFVEEYTIKE